MLLAAPKAPAPSGLGPPPWVLPVLVGGVLLCGLVLLLLAMRKKKRRPKMAPCPNCGKVIPSAWDACKFCGTATREQKAELKIISGPLVGRSIDLNRDVTTIGSAPENTVPLTDTGVSRKHVGIKKNGAGYELADLGSSNGVYVNGEKVARRKLEVGDVIRVGTTEMVFRT
jgi:type III secretion system (T3SS) inner membrane Yop/YscD-like protein